MSDLFALGIIGSMFGGGAWGYPSSPTTKGIEPQDNENAK
jgi:hypothetical protein